MSPTLRNIVHETEHEWSLKSLLSTGEDFREIRRGLVGYIIQGGLGNRVSFSFVFVCFSKDHIVLNKS